MRKRYFTICIFAAAFMLTGNVFAADGAHWDYKGAEGPEKWGDLGRENETCKLGKEQSPINIDKAVKATLEPIRFDYAPSAFNVVNNGHTIQVNYDKGNLIKVGTDQYELLQFHFHTPSEDMVHGRRAPMVIHLVHKSGAGKLAVVGVQLKPGETNATIQRIWDHLPKAGESKSIEGKINAMDLLPDDKTYYTYSGSLTTPPCSEGVRWMVLKNSVKLSDKQIQQFKKIYPMNARPVQPLNGRKIEVSG